MVALLRVTASIAFAALSGIIRALVGMVLKPESRVPGAALPRCMVYRYRISHMHNNYISDTARSIATAPPAATLPFLISLNFQGMMAAGPRPSTIQCRCDVDSFLNFPSQTRNSNESTEDSSRLRSSKVHVTLS